MTGRVPFRCGLIFCVAVAGLATAGAPPRQADLIRIGMLKSMFRDVPAAMFQAMTVPFQTVVEQQTGLKGQLQIVDSADELTKRLADRDMQLGVYHGFEFAWTKLKDANLQPLMMVSSNPGLLQTVVVVANSSPAKNICDCRGHSLAVPRGAREHSRLFLARQCRKHGCSVQEFFPATYPSPSLEDALDDVVDGISQVAIVEQSALQSFQRRKPGRFARLKTLSTSEPFPPSVIAFHGDGLDAGTLQKFRDGMLTANKTTLGNHLMSLMKINGFEPIPANYDQRLAEIVRAYPPPG
jgi:ABC-type phosphate/phosphonate transport system substrate-binding protein